MSERPKTLSEEAIEASLSEEELDAIMRDAKQRVAKEKKAGLTEAAKHRALMRARVEAGLIPEREERLDEMVTFTVDLPESGGEGVRIDQQVFLHGRQYTVTRDVYETIADITGRAWMHWAEVKGETRVFYNRMRGAFEMMGGHPQGSRSWHAGGGA